MSKKEKDIGEVVATCHSFLVRPTCSRSRGSCQREFKLVTPVSSYLIGCCSTIDQNRNTALVGLNESHVSCGWLGSLVRQTPSDDVVVQLCNQWHRTLEFMIDFLLYQSFSFPAIFSYVNQMCIHLYARLCLCLSRRSQQNEHSALINLQQRME